MTRWQEPILLTTGAFFAAIATAGVLIILILIITLMTPAISFDANEYLPQQSVLCPGDELVFQPTATLRRAPSVVRSAHTWVDVNSGVTIIQDNVLSAIIVYGPVPRTESVEMRVTVPSLPAGDYEYRTAILAGRVTTYEVSFSVPDSCKVEP